VNRGQHAGARPLFGDAILAFLLLNEARRRVVGAVFGVAEENSGLVTIFAIGAAVEMLSDKAPSIRKPAPPSIADTAIGAGALNEMAYRIAGDWSRSMPFFGALVALALLEKSFRPMLRGSVRGVRGSSRAVISGSRKIRTFLEGE
jgi:hypothetical protein